MNLFSGLLDNVISSNKKIGEILKEMNCVTDENIDKALELQQQTPEKRIGEILIDTGVLSERQVLDALSKQVMLPLVSVADYMKNTEVHSEIPLELMDALNIFPLEFQDDGTVLLIATCDPTNMAARDILNTWLKYPLRFALAASDEIAEAVRKVKNKRRAAAAKPDAPAKPKRLGDILLRAGVITRRQLDVAFRYQRSTGKKLGEILIHQNIVSEENLADALASQLKMRRVILTGCIVNPLVLSMIPRNMAERLAIIPLTIEDDGSLLIAMADPLDIMAIDEVKAMTGRLLRVTITTRSDLKKCTDIIYSVRHKPNDVKIVYAHELEELDDVYYEPSEYEAAIYETHEEEPHEDELRSPSEAEEARPAPESAAHDDASADREAAHDAEERSGSDTHGGHDAAAAADQQQPVSSLPVPVFQMKRSQPRLGDLLLKAGAITEDQLTHAFTLQRTNGLKLGEILISEGILNDIKLAEALSEQLSMPLLLPLTRRRPSPEAINLIPRSMAERLSLIPIAIDEQGKLFIVMADPLDLIAQDEVTMHTGFQVRIGITTRKDLESNLDRMYGLQDSLNDALDTLESSAGETLDLGISVSDNDIDAPVIKIVHRLMKQAISESASDIHIEIYKNIARVRFRVDGRLYTSFDYPVTLHAAVSSRLKIMSGMDITEKRRSQDGRITVKLDGRSVDMRVSSMPTLKGEKIVIRILDNEQSAVGLDGLGLEKEDMEHIDTFCGMPWGIMLVTGPTGCGKSTTLYSMLEKINEPDINIVTIEDPVEYEMPGVNQIHVNDRIGLTFESALRSILRQDPDKIMLGEIRDGITAQIAIRAALTGHFVFSTLHTNDAPSAVTRLTDMGIEPFLVAASLRGVIAQRLVRRLCPICREEYVLSDVMCGGFGLPSGTKAYRAKGCSQCRNGYNGRVGVYEIMMVDDVLRRMIADGALDSEIRSTAIDRGMKTLKMAGIKAAVKGLTSIEEVISGALL